MIFMPEHCWARMTITRRRSGVRMSGRRRREAVAAAVWRHSAHLLRSTTPSFTAARSPSREE